MKNTTFFERILQIIELYNIKSVNSFAKDYLKYDSSEKINRLKDENNKPSFGILEDISNKFEEIDANWLLTGRGEMLRKQNVQEEHTHKSILPSTHSLENQCKYTKNISDRKKIPLYNAEAAAGFGSFSEFLSDDLIIDHYDIPEFYSADFLIYITGSSMYPKYVSGDIVACKIIHEPQFIQWGRPHVIVTKEQGLLCKRLYGSLSGSEEHIQVYSENTKYDPFDIPNEDILGIALVLGVIHHE